MNSLLGAVRSPNRTVHGGAFDAATIRAVWAKGIPVAGVDPAQFRKDRCGAWMRFDAYGDTNSDYGWEVDHERPVARGGGDDIANLEPLYWRNNRHKADAWPQWTCGYHA